MKKQKHFNYDHATLGFAGNGKPGQLVYTLDESEDPECPSCVALIFAGVANLQLPKKATLEDLSQSQYEEDDYANGHVSFLTDSGRGGKVTFDYSTFQEIALCDHDGKDPLPKEPCPSLQDSDFDGKVLLYFDEVYEDCGIMVIQDPKSHALQAFALYQSSSSETPALPKGEDAPFIEERPILSSKIQKNRVVLTLNRQGTIAILTIEFDRARFFNI
jgi:hypothetical protein